MEDRAYYHIPAETLGAEAKIPLAKMGDSDEVFRAMADMMADCIKENNAGGKRTVFICPVGPVGQYAFFVRRVNEEGISLKDVWFFNMDEYLEDDGTYISQDSPLSFRGFMTREVYGKITPALLMPESQRVFPDPADPAKGDRHHRAPGLQRAPAGPDERGLCGPSQPRAGHPTRDAYHQRRGRPGRRSGVHA